MGVRRLPHVHLEAVQALDELGQFGKTVVPGIKIRLLPDQQVSQLPHKGVSVFVGDHIQGAGDQLLDLRRDLPLRFLRSGLRFRRGGGLRGRLLLSLLARLGPLRRGGHRLRFRRGLRLSRLVLGGGPNDLDIDELVTGHDEGTGRLLLPHADDLLARLTQPGGQTGEVGIAGHQYETVALSGIEDVHGVDDHSRISGVLSGGIAVLLDGGDGVLQQDRLPGGHIGGGPVPVDALDGGGTVDGDLGHHVPHGGPGGVVRVNEHRQAQALVV